MNEVKLTQIKVTISGLDLDSVYAELLSHCRQPETRFGDEWNGALADIAAQRGCSEYQVDGIYWFGIQDTPNPSDTYPAPIFGVGGIKLHEHDTTPPFKHGEVCSKCGCAESDGAMFTTLAGSGICDDCV